MEKRRSDDGKSELAGPRWLHHDALSRITAAAVAAERDKRSLELRLAMEQTALRLSGEVGYGRMTVIALVQHSESNLDRFYKAYRSKFDCYLAGYTWAIEALCDRLLSVGAEAPDWPSGMRLALVELADFIAADASFARGLFAEVFVAGGAAREKRNEVFERLSRAVDRARRETTASRHSPPPVTSRFILSAIEAAVLQKLSTQSDEDFGAQVPGLLLLAIGPYFGAEVAIKQGRRLS